MGYLPTATTQCSAAESEEGGRAGLTPSQRLTLVWLACATVLALLTGARLAASGWWSMVVTWLDWPYPGWLNLLTTAIGIALAIIAWCWRERVEGVWRGVTLAASALSAAVSLFLIVCAVLALLWLILCLFAGVDDEDSTYRARARGRRRRHRRRPSRYRY